MADKDHEAEHFGRLLIAAHGEDWSTFDSLVEEAAKGERARAWARKNVFEAKDPNYRDAAASILRYVAKEGKFEAGFAAALEATMVAETHPYAKIRMAFALAESGYLAPCISQVLRDAAKDTDADVVALAEGYLEHAF